MPLWSLRRTRRDVALAQPANGRSGGDGNNGPAGAGVDGAAEVDSGMALILTTWNSLIDGGVGMWWRGPGPSTSIAFRGRTRGRDKQDHSFSSAAWAAHVLRARR